MSPDANVRETLKEVLGESVSSPNSQKETEGQTSKEKGETQAGGTPQYVAGIDISDIPAEDRPRIVPLLEKKLNLLDKGYQPKFKEVAQLKEALNELAKEGIDVSEARQVLNDHIQKKKNPLATEKKEAKKTLDNLIEQAPNEQKESLRQLRQILNEETDVDNLRKKVAEMESILKNVSVGYVDVRKKDVEVQISELQKKYGKDLIEKYHDVMVEESLKFNVSPQKVLYNRADEDEIEQAISAKSKRKEEKLNAVSSQGSGVSGSSENIDTKNTKWKDVIRQVTKIGV